MTQLPNIGSPQVQGSKMNDKGLRLQARMAEESGSVLHGHALAPKSASPPHPSSPSPPPPSPPGVPLPPSLKKVATAAAENPPLLLSQAKKVNESDNLAPELARSQPTRSAVEAAAKPESQLEAATATKAAESTIATDASPSHATFAAASTDGGESAKAAVVEMAAVEEGEEALTEEVPTADGGESAEAAVVEKMAAKEVPEKVNQSDDNLAPELARIGSGLRTRSEVDAAAKPESQLAATATEAKTTIAEVSLLLCHPY